jgi:phenylpropionate dioxygenase-like ring-hydroxylating dioxygenase large terminal subunit
VNRDWNASWTLGKDFIPKGRYLDREYFELELEHLWPRVWQIACREEQLRGVGDYFEYMIGDQSILLVRTAPDQIRAYFNACRHRGTRLANGCGKFEGSHIRCPFHGWTWKLDGEVAAVPLSDEFSADAMDPAYLRLRQCRVDTWGGFVFINMDPSAPPLHEAIAPSTQYLDPVRLGDMGVLWHKVVELPVNWKAALEAFLESYHVAATHPEYAALGTDAGGFVYYNDGGGHSHYGIPLSAGEGAERRLDVDERDQFYRYVVWNIEQIGAMYTERDRHLVERIRQRELGPGETAIGAYMQELYAHAELTGVDLPVLTPEQGEHLGGNSIFPNFFCLPLPSNCLAYRSRPSGTDHGSTIWDVWSLMTYPRGEKPPYETQYVDYRDEAQVGRVLHQDFSNLLEVRVGTRSRGYEGARLNLRQEMGILHMHEEIDRYLKG